MLPAFGVARKFRRPARKSSFRTLSVLAMNPATSIFAPWPTMMPAGLTSHTRPLELSVPSSTEGSLVITRFRTLLAAEVWLKRVVSFAPIEKVFQLMMAPLLLLTVSSLPACAMLALPLTAWGPVGLDHAGAEVKQAEIATTIR